MEDKIQKQNKEAKTLKDILDQTLIEVREHAKDYVSEISFGKTLTELATIYQENHAFNGKRARIQAISDRIKNLTANRINDFERYIEEAEKAIVDKESEAIEAHHYIGAVNDAAVSNHRQAIDMLKYAEEKASGKTVPELTKSVEVIGQNSSRQIVEPPNTLAVEVAEHATMAIVYAYASIHLRNSVNASQRIDLAPAIFHREAIDRYIMAKAYEILGLGRDASTAHEKAAEAGYQAMEFLNGEAKKDVAEHALLSFRYLVDTYTNGRKIDALGKMGTVYLAIAEKEKGVKTLKQAVRCGLEEYFKNISDVEDDARAIKASADIAGMIVANCLMLANYEPEKPWQGFADSYQEHINFLNKNLAQQDNN